LPRVKQDAAQAELDAIRGTTTVAKTERDSAIEQAEKARQTAEAARQTAEEARGNLVPQIRELDGRVISLTEEKNIAITNRDVLIEEIGAALRRADDAQDESTRWRIYADALDSFIDAEVAGYWGRVRHVRPQRSANDLPEARKVAA